MRSLELVLVSREQQRDGSQTADYRLEIVLGDSLKPPGLITELSPSDWPGSRHSAPEDYKPVDLSHRSHSLPGFSAFGTGERNEFATWIQGRETFLSSSTLRDACEEDIRSFAERSDHTEGFMLTTPVSDGFGGLASVFLETLRDDFPKHPIFTTAMISDSVGWKRPDTERSINQRMLNNALSIQHLEELSSMLLPIQPPSPWDGHPQWTRFLRDDMPKRETYSQILTSHLQSANSELREVDGLNTVVNQLNWRGDNKIAHLQGAAPLLPPEHLEGPQGVQVLKDSIKDFSVLPNLPERKASARAEDPNTSKPFAQYSITRGYEDAELERLGEILEKSTPLVEPLAIWVALPQPYPFLSTSLPIFRSLIPSGRPLIISPPPNPDPLAPSGLFGLPDPLFPTASTYFVQPRSIPLLTTLSTSPAARHLLSHLSAGVKELLRVRSSHLVEYENGEYALGREGLGECKERLETLADNYGGANGGRESDSEEERDGMDEDEDF